MIKDNLENLRYRGNPIKETKYTISDNHLSFVKKQKIYEYYKCDNCGCEIKIAKDWERSEGGVIQLDKSIIKKPYSIVIAVCNGCLNKILKQFEEVQ